MSVTVCFQRNDNGFGTIGTERQPGLCPVDMPAYQSSGAAGIDLHSAYEVTIPAGLMRRVSTGFNVKVPEGFVGFVCPRSGLAFKHTITVLNAPGVIDCDYTGELFVMLINHGEEPVTIRRNDRVAQLVVVPVVQAVVLPVEIMPETARGGLGFGSTGGMPDLSGNKHHLTKSRYPTPEEVEKIDADMVEFRREFDCFTDKFMRLSPQEQEKVMAAAGVAFEKLGPYGPVTPSRVNRIVESLNLTPEEAARILPQLEEAEAEALKDPKNQQLIADAMEKQRQPYSIGHTGV